MKVLVSHPTGNENVRHVLKGMLEANILFQFYTSIATFPNNIFGLLSKFSTFSEFNRRSFDPKLQEYTISTPLKELGRIAATRCKFKALIAHGDGVFSIDKIYHQIDVKVSKTITKQKVDAIYAYEDGALASFIAAKKHGIACLYDLPIGYWRAARRLLLEEQYNRPDWACTLTGFKDSEVKLLRKDKELALADHIFVASSFTKETLNDYIGVLAPVSVIPYGFPPVVSHKNYEKIENRPLKLLFVGSLSQRKGIANVLEAVGLLGDSVSLTIVGHRVTNNCQPLNDGLNRHTWIPSLPHAQILEQMRANDVLLFPSLFEGFGLVITEAMSQGTPVITTNRTAGADLIKHGENGWLVETGSTQSLIGVLSSILHEPDLIATVGLKAMETAALRSWKVYDEELTAKILTLNS